MVTLARALSYEGGEKGFSLEHMSKIESAEFTDGLDAGHRRK